MILKIKRLKMNKKYCNLLEKKTTMEKTCPTRKIYYLNNENRTLPAKQEKIIL